VYCGRRERARSEWEDITKMFIEKRRERAD
jgi:hypothetical protein